MNRTNSKYLSELFITTFALKCRLTFFGLCDSLSVLRKNSFYSYKIDGGKDVLIYNGHEYLLKSTTLDNKKVWRCRKVNKFNCSSVVMTKMDEIVKEPNEHTHVGDPVAVRRNVVLDTITQAASTSHETTRYIIGDALPPETNDILMRLPKKIDNRT